MRLAWIGSGLCVCAVYGCAGRSSRTPLPVDQIAMPDTSEDGWGMPSPPCVQSDAQTRAAAEYAEQTLAEMFADDIPSAHPPYVGYSDGSLNTMLRTCSERSDAPEEGCKQSDIISPEQAYCIIWSQPISGVVWDKLQLKSIREGDEMFGLDTPQHSAFDPFRWIVEGHGLSNHHSADYVGNNFTYGTTVILSASTGQVLNVASYYGQY